MNNEMKHKIDRMLHIDADAPNTASNVVDDSVSVSGIADAADTVIIEETMK